MSLFADASLLPLLPLPSSPLQYAVVQRQPWRPTMDGRAFTARATRWSQTGAKRRESKRQPAARPVHLSAQPCSVSQPFPPLRWTRLPSVH
ncbi:hypothetical protein LY76DRAFT_31003 [Colletotrichum caudatum]|nr:hypothetical protein LY76DRAFT_31003 [Colletotrichum caudatum]